MKLTKQAEAAIADPRVTLLCDLYSKPRSVSSDMARQYAPLIAALASQGLITTRVVGRSPQYGTLWRVSPAGVLRLQQLGCL